MSVIRSGIKIAAALLIMMPMVAAAQDAPPKSPQERAQSQTRMMQKRLSLTADQATAVSSINMRMADRMDSLMHTSADKKTIGATRKQMNADRETQFQHLLSQDQYKQYQAMEEERKQRMMQRKQAMQGQGDGQMDNTGNN